VSDARTIPLRLVKRETGAVRPERVARQEIGDLLDEALCRLTRDPEAYSLVLRARQRLDDLSCGADVLVEVRNAKRLVCGAHRLLERLADQLDAE